MSTSPLPAPARLARALHAAFLARDALDQREAVEAAWQATDQAPFRQHAAEILAWLAVLDAPAAEVP